MAKIYLVLEYEFEDLDSIYDSDDPDDKKLKKQRLKYYKKQQEKFIKKKKYDEEMNYHLSATLYGCKVGPENMKIIGMRIEE